MAILATVILTAIDPIGQFRKAQDTRRKSDLAQLQRVLEAYYQDFGRYPIHTPSGAYTYTMNDGSDDGAKQWGTGWSPYIDIIPVDPNSSKSYIYYSDADNGNQSYRIYTSLDRGGKDPDACDGGSACAGVPDVISGCPGIDETCNFGVTSPNISP